MPHLHAERILCTIWNGIVMLTAYIVLGNARDTCGITTPSLAMSYKGFHSPWEIIAHAFWLHPVRTHRFSLIFRDMKELLAAHRMSVSYETMGTGF